MQIKKRYHSYPVLAPYTNDYPDSIFAIDRVEDRVEGKNYMFKVLLNLEDKEIERLIGDEKAEFIIHVECSKTSFRKIYISKESSLDIIIESKNLDGSVEFAPFIIAKDNIYHYKNDSFHDDLRDFSFNINRGQYLCIGNRAIIDIVKNKDELRQLSSIIRIAQVADLENETKVNLEGSRIQILISSHMYSRYTYASRSNHRLRVLHSMIVLPALIHVLYELREDAESDFEIYSEKRWFQSLKLRFEDMGMTLDYNLFNEKSPYELAQIVLDYPVKDALDNMYESDQEVTN